EVTPMHRSGDAAQGRFIPSCFFVPLRLCGSNCPLPKPASRASAWHHSLFRVSLDLLSLVN
ncbi:MAG TPA: hypothetical protein VFT78_08820, partial [Hanamia sp.]|nr:hypothetical protein [Hanamia sp.]